MCKGCFQQRILRQLALPLAVLLFLLSGVTPAAASRQSGTSARILLVSKKKKKSPKGKTKAAETNDAAKPTKSAADKPSKSTAGKSSKATAKKSANADDDAKPSKASKSAVTKSVNAAKSARAARRARTARIRVAFQASNELRPMAQQLATMRTPGAYAGVAAYARKHTGAAAAAAYLALGHAYLSEKKYSDAATNLRLARQAGGELSDYADFLAAEALRGEGNFEAASAIYRDFAASFPDSIFLRELPERQAQTLLALNDAVGASRVLAAAAGSTSAGRSGFELVQAQVAESLGRSSEAEHLYRRVLFAFPLSEDALTARTRLASLGVTLTSSERRTVGDAYWNAGRWSDAAEQYRALSRASDLDAGSRDVFAVAAAACDLKLKRLSTAQAEALPATQDETGARRLYLLMELARAHDDSGSQKNLVERLQSQFPHSPWLAEALFSSGNMYLLRRDYSTAAGYYTTLATEFPSVKKAATAHWRAGWLNYRMGNFGQAEQMFDEQIRLFPSATETIAALYWRARLYETRDGKPAQAAAHYRRIAQVYNHYFYAQMSRMRLASLGATQPVSSPQLDRFTAPPVPPLDASFPEDSPHLAKARLIANAGLNEFVAREISAEPDSSGWSNLAEARIYTSFGDYFRALRSMKRALPSAATAPIKSIPLPYWRILFPEPWWPTIKEYSAKNNLDPYLVASLIRQESEYNPAAVSRANAIGLMQLLPSVGRQMAREEGLQGFDPHQLLDPVTNIRLGTRYLRQSLDHFGGTTEYALAAYNAGGNRVEDWQSAGPYSGMDEFVESIPFTETREYVEAILRNIETYKAIDAFAATATMSRPSPAN
jgi:soluble lytic murein transglycosylase